jgi:hypothetical protein
MNMRFSPIVAAFLFLTYGQFNGWIGRIVVTWFDKTIFSGGTFNPDESVLFLELSSSSSEWSRLGAFFGLFVTDSGLLRSAAT